MSFEIKIFITFISALIFSLFFVIIALIVPTHDKKVSGWQPAEKPKTRVGQISKSMRKGFGQ